MRGSAPRAAPATLVLLACSCAGVACPPLPIPGARMPACGYEAPCANGACTHSCTPIGGAP